ncbi:DUF2024 family protein [Chitinophaga horti]|uniref:DUF2024 family protein n=1 Tax=Chitinophaga horti TaxID=2920382 RepID=A0ABY6IX73_9BACT|nr:DUF2024 family protein [Chitinophaga horti]UYQ91984.1 DUF2024 family protein [Chitinophaga horti]
MKVAVYDTYVPKKDGTVMHFDILVPDTMKNEDQVYAYGRSYLQQKEQEGQPMSTKECRFCHIEEATAEVVSDIERQGYSIIEMQGCN